MRELYHALVPPETRYWLYKLRNPAQFRRLRTVANVHDKGTFSLRAYDQRECIFVHITKTAGTSVAKSLFGELPYHYTASQYRIIFGRRDFNRYFKFAFVRNPWDRLYSAWSYLKGGGWDAKDRAWAKIHLADTDDFNEFVLSWLNTDRLQSHLHFRPQRHFLCDRHGRILIDHLAYFETIQSDFKLIRDRIHPAAELPHTNRSARDDYRKVYSAAAVDRVAALYADDISMFGYTFDGLSRKRIVDGAAVDS